MSEGGGTVVRTSEPSRLRVRRRIRTRVEIPDFTRRRDEIGHLSGALRDMTDDSGGRTEIIRDPRDLDRRDLALDGKATGAIEFAEGYTEQLRGDPAIVTLGSFGRIAPL